MIRSKVLLRGAKGFGWYSHFKAKPEDFAIYTEPTPFDWSLEPVIPRPKAFFAISSNNEPWGRIEFELASDIVPKTVDNFCRLVTGQNIKNFSYKNTKIHKIRKGDIIMGGDVERNTGEGSHSAFKDRYIRDENYIIPHSSRGLLSMASIGVNTGGSQFYISLNPTRYMNGHCVVFGRVIAGDDVLSRIEKVFTSRGSPSNDITITDCGIITNK